MTWIRFTRDMGLYEKGMEANVPKSIARRAVIINRAVRIDPPEAPSPAVETAATSPPENTASRTRDPTRCGWEYTGSGWWKAPDGSRVRARKDAPLPELKRKYSPDEDD